MLSQAKECQEPLEAGRSKEGCSSRAFKGSMGLLRPRFQISGLQNCEKINFCCFDYPVVICYGSPRELIHLPRTTTIFSCFLLKISVSLLHLALWSILSLLCVWCEVRVKVNFSHMDIWFPAPFLEKTILSPINYLVLLLRINWP